MYDNIYTDADERKIEMKRISFFLFLVFREDFMQMQSQNCLLDCVRIKARVKVFSSAAVSTYLALRDPGRSQPRLVEPQ